MVPIKPPPREKVMGVVPQSPRRKAQILDDWECDHCQSLNAGNRCTECGASRKADIRGRNVLAGVLDESWDDEPDSNLHNVIER